MLRRSAIRAWPTCRGQIPRSGALGLPSRRLGCFALLPLSTWLLDFPRNKNRGAPQVAVFFKPDFDPLIDRWTNVINGERKCHVLQK